MQTLVTFKFRSLVTLTLRASGSNLTIALALLGHAARQCIHIADYRPRCVNQDPAGCDKLCVLVQFASSIITGCYTRQ